MYHLNGNGIGLYLSRLILEKEMDILLLSPYMKKVALLIFGCQPFLIKFLLLYQAASAAAGGPRYVKFTTFFHKK